MKDVTSLVRLNQRKNSTPPITVNAAPTGFAYLGLVKNRIAPTIRIVAGIIMNSESVRGNAQVGVIDFSIPHQIFEVLKI